MLLVEIIATKSQNCVWKASINNKHVENEHIKRVSIDRFYEEVTGIKNAFFQICQQLPITIKEVVEESNYKIQSSNIIINEIKKINPNILVAFYSLAFSTYLGFDELFSSKIN